MTFLFRFSRIHARGRSRLRTMMRGYIQLKRESRIGVVRNLKSALVDCRHNVVDKQSSPIIFGIAVQSPERTVRQYMMAHFAGATMNRAILHLLGSKCPLVLPLPRAWQSIFTSQGLKVNHWASTLAWYTTIVKYFGRSILIALQLLLRLIAAQSKPLVPSHYAYFHDLTVDNLPLPIRQGCSYDICSWYAQWNGRVRSVEYVRHNVRRTVPVKAGELQVEYSDPPFLLLRGIPEIIWFTGWLLIATLLSAIDLLRGRWWHALMLGEAAKAKAVSLCTPEQLALDYLFHFSGSSYRPLWTYEAEKHGARIACYFYSCSEQPKLKSGYESQDFEWGAANWPLYLVWDEYQAMQLRRSISLMPNIQITGPIWFSDSIEDSLKIPSRSIAVFNIEAHRPALHFGFSTLEDYVSAHPDFNERFLWDVQQVLAEQSLIMAFKRKREIGERQRKRDKKLYKEISAQENVVMVKPSLAALNLIKQCEGIISFPFTSTALYLREHNIPSAYYDPTGWIQPDDRAAHGIPILIGIGELRDWVIRNFRKI
jgi:polysaccharide biosynthesis PFTS motif protein